MLALMPKQKRQGKQSNTRKRTTLARPLKDDLLKREYPGMGISGATRKNNKPKGRL